MHFPLVCASLQASSAAPRRYRFAFGYLRDAIFETLLSAQRERFDAKPAALITRQVRARRANDFVDIATQRGRTESA